MSCCFAVMLVACSQFNTLSVYLTHLLNVHTGDALSNSLRLHKKVAQVPVASLTCCSHSAVTLSEDARDVVVWDIESCTIKVQAYCVERVHKYCLSLTETHLAVVTESGRVLLYAVESVDEDLPVAPIKQFHLQVASDLRHSHTCEGYRKSFAFEFQNSGSCWLTSLHAQPYIICVIAKTGVVSAINVHTLSVHVIQVGLITPEDSSFPNTAGACTNDMFFRRRSFRRTSTRSSRATTTSTSSRTSGGRSGASTPYLGQSRGSWT